MKRFTMALAAGALMLSAGVAQGQTVFFSGFTDGCFNGGCPPAPVGPGFSPKTTGGLTYEDAVFEGFTAGGFLGIGDAPNGPGTLEVDNFGAFYLTAAPVNYNGRTFQLLVSFILPTDAAGSSQLFTAALTGRVLAPNTGGVLVDFDNTPVAFGPGGRYTIQVNDVSLQSPNAGVNSAPVTGVITATQVIPEPATMGLLGTGLLGLLGLAKRRRDKQASEA